MSLITLPQGVVDATDITAITQLILLERESRDTGRWARMRQCFHADALIRISWFKGDADGFVDGSIDMARRGMLAKHRLGPVMVRIAGDRAVATLGGVIEIPVNVQGAEAQLSSYARLYYRAERRAGTWKLSGFDVVYMRDALMPAIPGETLQIRATELARFRRSYRLLSYALTLQGYAPSMDLPGEDRPDLVDGLERELFGWAGVEP